VGQIGNLRPIGNRPSDLVGAGDLFAGGSAFLPDYTPVVYDVCRFSPGAIFMNKRINIVLPEATIQTIDRMARPGERSRFINQAVKHFVTHQSTEALRTRLERATVRDRDLDSEIAADWSAVDGEAWQRLDIEERKTSNTRGAAKSTLRPSTRP